MYSGNIEKETIANENFRKVLFTGKYSQLVLMSLKPGEEIGAEVHETIDQFIRVEAGEGKTRVEGEEKKCVDGAAIVVPAGANHNFINTSTSEALKIYTIYSPPEHRDGTIHRTKEEAIQDAEDHYHV